MYKLPSWERGAGLFVCFEEAEDHLVPNGTNAKKKGKWPKGLDHCRV